MTSETLGMRKEVELDVFYMYATDCRLKAYYGFHLQYMYYKLKSVSN